MRRHAAATRLLLSSLVLATAAGSAAAAKSDELPDPDSWVKASTPNFTLYSNANASKTKKTAVRLERFRQALERMTQGFDLSGDIPNTIVLFKNDPSYERYKTRPDGTVRNVSGLFLPGPFRNTMTLDISASSRPMRVVYHEYFHTVMDRTLGDLPLWLNEGLAEYFSTFEYNDISASAEVGHPIEDHVSYILEYGMLPWDTFFATTPLSSHYNEGTRQGSFYAQAWLTTHYLHADDARTKQLGAYLTALRLGQDEDASFDAAFGVGREELGKRVVAYMRERGSFLVFDFGEEFGEVEAEVSDVGAAELHYRLGDLLGRLGPLEDARRHLDAAAEAGWPRAEVETSLGVAAYENDDLEAAAAHWTAAIAAEQAPAAALYRLALLRLAESSSDLTDFETPDVVLQARELLTRALEREPEHFESLVAFARTYLFGNDEPQPAVGAIRMARLSRPLDLDAQVVESALTARAGAVERAFRQIDGVRRHNPRKADEAETLATAGVLLAAYRRAEEDDAEGAATLLGDALRHVRNADAQGHLRALHDVIASGGTMILGDADQESLAATDAAVDQFNSAIALANAGDLAGAVAKLEALAETCPEPKICKMAGQRAAEMAKVLRHNSVVGSLNEAIRMFQAGDIKKGSSLLLELEATVEEPELREMVLETMVRAGVRVPKKK